MMTRSLFMSASGAPLQSSSVTLDGQQLFRTAVRRCSRMNIDPAFPALAAPQAVA
jgi:hypothetical protein